MTAKPIPNSLAARDAASVLHPYTNALANESDGPLVIAEGIHTGGNFIKSDTTTALLRSLGAAPSPPDILREPEAR